MLEVLWQANDRFVHLNEQRATEAAEAAQIAVDAVIDSSGEHADSEE